MSLIMSILNGLGIDLWALLVYLVNFGIIVLVLSRFVYRPLLNFTNKRRDLIRQNISEAEELKKKFGEELRAKEEETKALLGVMHKEITTAKEHAQRRAEELITEAQKERSRLLIETEKEINTLKTDIYRQVESDIKVRIEKILLLILGTNIPPEVVKRSVEEAWSDVSK